MQQQIRLSRSVTGLASVARPLPWSALQRQQCTAASCRLAHRAKLGCRKALKVSSVAAERTLEKAEESTEPGRVEVGGSGAEIDLQLPRRRLQVTFSCNKCGARSQRLVNPLAWDRGTVFVQCAGCEVWHTIKDAAGLVEEVRFGESDAQVEGLLGQDLPPQGSGGSSTPEVLELPTEEAGALDNTPIQHGNNGSDLGVSQSAHKQQTDFNDDDISAAPVRDSSAPIPAPSEDEMDCGDEEACELSW